MDGYFIIQNIQQEYPSAQPTDALSMSCHTLSLGSPPTACYTQMAHHSHHSPNHPHLQQHPHHSSPPPYPTTSYSSSSSSSATLDHPSSSRLYSNSSNNSNFTSASTSTSTSASSPHSSRSLGFLKNHTHHHQGSSSSTTTPSSASSSSKLNKLHGSKGSSHHNNSNNNNNTCQDDTAYSIPALLQQESSHMRGENVMIQDWLQKRSTSLQLVWKRRWCVLRDDRLIYYRSATDTKPLGILKLAEYSVLTAGPDISRKSKLAFRLSSAENIPHQHQHHLFFAESPQALHNWLYALQAHINHARSAIGAGMGPGLGLDLGDQTQLAEQGLGEQSIIDKVLDRLHLDDPSQGTQPHRLPPNLPYLPPNFPQSHEDNNDTWSSTSSMPNSSTNTSHNLEYIFALNQKSSMDSARDTQSPSGSYVQSHVSPHSGHAHTSSYSSNGSGFPVGSSFADHQSTTSDSTLNNNRASTQSTDYYGRTSLQNSRFNGTGHGFHAGSSSVNSYANQQCPQSPSAHPVRSSVQSTRSIDNASPSMSGIGSPFASPTLTSQTQAGLNAILSPGNMIPPSPRTHFYRSNETMSPSRRPPSIASSTSISTIASSGDVSTINDLGSEHSHSESGKSAGAAFMGLVSGMKKKKERNGNSSAGSSHSGSGSGSSPGMKLFTSGICSFSGCSQMAKTCAYHNKKHRAALASDNGGDKDKEAVPKKSKSLWSGSSDKNQSTGNLSVLTAPGHKSHGFTSPFTSGKKSGQGLSSKSMVSLSRDVASPEPDYEIIPVPTSHLLNTESSSLRTRSPSVSAVDDALLAAQQKQQRYNSDPIYVPSDLPARSHTPPPTLGLQPKPFQPLPTPLPPPRTTAGHTTPFSRHTKETFNLSRKMGLQVGSEFGTNSGAATASSSSSSSSVSNSQDLLAGTTLNGSFFVANHHRTMQKLQALQPWKTQPNGPLPPTPTKNWALQIPAQHTSTGENQQQLQQQSVNQFNGGVSRHIIAPDELALAIEQEAEETRKQQVLEKEASKGRPTSMIKSSMTSLHTPYALSTVPEAGGTISSAGGVDNGDRIISCQEQIASACSAEQESQKSPISGIVSSAPQGHFLPTVPPPSMMQLAGTVSTRGTNGDGSSNGSYGSGKTSVAQSPRSNSFSGGSGVSSSGSAAYLASLAKYSSQTMLPLSGQQHFSQQEQTRARHPMSPLDTFQFERSDFPVRSLPPPKRHGHDSTKMDSKGNPRRDEMPRRSSAAAAVTLSSAAAAEKDSRANLGSPTGNALPRPTFMARRQSSSPVLIRVVDQGGQNISPLLNHGWSRVFGGDGPARDVVRPGPPPLDSPCSGSNLSVASSISASTFSICSLTQTQSDTGDERRVLEGTAGQTPAAPGRSTPVGPPATVASPGSSGRSSPAGQRGPRFRAAYSPLASVTPAAPSGSFQFPGPATSSSSSSLDALPAVVLDSFRNPDSAETSKRVLLPQNMFQFPGPSPLTVNKVDGHGRPLSTCSSICSFTSSSGVEGGAGGNGADYSAHSSRTVSPVLSPSLHAAALEMYPGLRKLSLFTAAVAGQPPPPLLLAQQRKSSEAAMSSPTLSTMEDDDGDYEDEDEIQSEQEDWAGNMKSTRRIREPAVGAHGIRRGSLPFVTSGSSPLSSSSSFAQHRFQSQQQQQVPFSPMQKARLQATPSPPPATLPLPPAPTGPMPSPLSAPTSATTTPLPPPPSQPLPATSSVFSPRTISSPPPQALAVSAAAAAALGAPAIPPRSPHRSAPTSPVTLRSPRSCQQIPPIPNLTFPPAGTLPPPPPPSS